MLGMRQELRMQQRLAPQLIQSLHLLQLPALDLEQLVQLELEQNPLLEEVPEMEIEQKREEPPAEGQEPERELSDDFDAQDWSTYLNDANDMNAGHREERDYSAERYEPVAVYEGSLSEDLMEQAGLILSDGTDRQIAEYIIGNLDESGYLAATLEEMSAAVGQPLERIEKVLKVIQTLDPPGVGARDLREALLIQLAERGLEEHPAYRIVGECFEELLHRRTKEIMRKLHLERDDVAESLDVIASLNPKPGTLTHGEGVRPVVPDLIVEQVDGDYVVMLNDRSVPHVRINRGYRDLLTSPGSDDAKKYVVDRLNSAKWLIKSIEQRRTTMLKVMNAIVKHQRLFFDNGITHLKPMVLQEIADEIRMHVSTVSRVSNGKYVQTPHGVFELKYFFDGKLGVQDGEDMASKAVKDKIRRMIEGEDKRTPLSDQAIADQLTAEDGIDIARRTVAKYRDQLRISSARLRKDV